jgi:hypothetical protein
MSNSIRAELRVFIDAHGEKTTIEALAKWCEARVGEIRDESIAHSPDLAALAVDAAYGAAWAGLAAHLRGVVDEMKRGQFGRVR